MLYNEPGRAAAMFTVRGNQCAKVVLLFRSPALDIDFGDPSAQYDVIRRRFTGMGWYTKRLIESLPDAYDFYRRNDPLVLSRNAFAQISGQIGECRSYSETRRGRAMDTICPSAAVDGSSGTACAPA